MAAKVLVYTKTMQPQFAQVTEEMVDGWAERMARVPVPPAAFEEAAKQFQSENVSGDWLTVGWLIARAKKVSAGWRHDPATRDAMHARDEAMADERDRQLASGEFGRSRGYRPAMEAPRREVPDFVSELVARFRAGQA